jgi:redox-sensitive bicupin YhaK (pirin superfamily)
MISGKPIGEPVARYGPIVMNTEDELQTAFKEYEEGCPIKYRDDFICYQPNNFLALPAKFIFK